MISTRQQQQRRLTNKPPKVKLKCLVLGACNAGKTSIIRRYFYKTFDEGIRVPTLGSDWYTTRVSSSSIGGDGVDDTSGCDDVMISLQVWDTPGRERFDAKRLKPNQNHHGHQQHQKPSPGLSFLSQADAIMLVYDMTSTSSFKQLLKWYADLSSLLERRRPTLVVGNKLDILLAGQRRQQISSPLRNNHKHQKGGNAQNRDVLGLGGRYRGNDYRYEYQVSRIDHESEQHLQSASGASKRRRGVGGEGGPMEISTYLADRENWTTDGSYLHSLITTEDESHPDTDMVKLWCMRNGLEHVEASAATGKGIDEAFRDLMRLAVESKDESLRASAAAVGQHEPQQEHQKIEADPKPTDPLPLPPQPLPPPKPKWSANKELDLHQRYAPKEERCCLPILQPLRRWLRF